MSSLGASTRASVSLTRAAHAAAILRGRDYVLPDDVKDIAALGAVAPRPAGLGRRRADARARDLIEEILTTVRRAGDGTVPRKT